MSWPLIILVLVIGIVLVALEIIVIPGGFSGAIGGLLAILAVWQTYASYGNVAGNIVLLCSLAVLIVLIVILMKSKTWNRVSLHEAVDSKVNTVDKQEIQVGSRGVTVTRLAPSGNALIHDQVVEVHTVSEFVDPDTPIEVIEIEGYRIVVKPVQEQETTPTESDNQ